MKKKVAKNLFFCVNAFLNRVSDNWRYAIKVHNHNNKKKMKTKTFVTCFDNIWGGTKFDKINKTVNESV